MLSGHTGRKRSAQGMKNHWGTVSKWLMTSTSEHFRFLSIQSLFNISG